MESDFAKDLTLHLAANIEEAERISAMPLAEAAREIGRIEGMIKASADKGQPAPKVSKMKAPIAPVGAGNTGSALEYYPGMPPAKLLEWERSLKG
jgi:hypothetical protein